MEQTKTYWTLNAALIAVGIAKRQESKVSIKRNGGIWYVTSKEK